MGVRPTCEPENERATTSRLTPPRWLPAKVRPTAADAQQTPVTTADYEAGLRLNDAKERCGLISAVEARQVRERNRAAVAMMKRVDEAMAIADEARRREALDALRSEIRNLDTSTFCDKTELDWPKITRVTNIARKAPTMNRSPWAKLMSSMIP